MRLILSILIALSLTISTALPALALERREPSERREAPERRPFVLPEDSVEVSEDVFYLGRDEKISNVEGYAIVHRRPDRERPRELRARRTKPARRESKCYGFISSGAKWKTVEDWVMNPSNTRGMDEGGVFNTMAAALAKWEDAADGTLGNGNGKNIFGAGTPTSTQLEADTVSTDNLNEAYFGAIEDSNTIAVTIVWGVFSGPTRNRRLVEWDQIYDEAKFDWSLTGEIGKMDFDNLATHENGHSAGLADIYTSSCSAVSMYGYASEGETNKRSLEPDDITGIRELYR